MNFLEKDLETIIFETDNDLLTDKGLFISGHKKRQLRIGNYGIADIVTFKRFSYYDETIERYRNFLYVNVFELKKDEISMSTILQALSYVKGIERWFKLYRPNIRVRLSITVVGKRIKENSSFVYLFDYMYNSIGSENNNLSLNAYTYKYKIDGISFVRHSGYNLIDEGF